MNKGKPIECHVKQMKETTCCIPETGNNVRKENVSHFVPSLIKSLHMSFNQSVTLCTWRFSLCSVSFFSSAWSLPGKTLHPHGERGGEKDLLVLCKLLKSIYFIFPFLQTSANCCSSLLKETSAVPGLLSPMWKNVYRLEALGVLIFKDFSCKPFKAWAKISGKGNFSSCAWFLPPPPPSRAIRVGLCKWVSSLAKM